jgi:hypothetical protein
LYSDKQCHRTDNCRNLLIDRVFRRVRQKAADQRVSAPRQNTYQDPAKVKVDKVPHQMQQRNDPGRFVSNQEPKLLRSAPAQVSNAGHRECSFGVGPNRTRHQTSFPAAGSSFRHGRGGQEMSRNRLNRKGFNQGGRVGMYRQHRKHGISSSSSLQSHPIPHIVCRAPHAILHGHRQ